MWSSQIAAVRRLSAPVSPASSPQEEAHAGQQQKPSRRADANGRLDPHREHCFGLRVLGWQTCRGRRDTSGGGLRLK